MTTDGTDQLHHPAHPARDAIPAYALGVLDAAERAELEAHLAGCEECRRELARQEALVGELGLAAAPVPPSPELRAALLSELHHTDAAFVTDSRRFDPRTAALAVAAALAIVSVIVLATLLARTMEERDDARFAEREIAEYLSDGGTLSPLVPAPDAPADARPGHGTLAVAPSQDQAMLVVDGLEPSGGGRRYMAWAERDGERVRLGELHVDDEGVGWLLLTGPEPMSSYEKVGITRFSPDAPEGESYLVASIE